MFWRVLRAFCALTCTINRDGSGRRDGRADGPRATNIYARLDYVEIDRHRGTVLDPNDPRYDDLSFDGGIEGVQATCERCDNRTTAYGTTAESKRFALLRLRETCPRREKNFYEGRSR